MAEKHHHPHPYQHLSFDDMMRKRENGQVPAGPFKLEIVTKIVDQAGGLPADGDRKALARDLNEIASRADVLHAIAFSKTSTALIETMYRVERQAGAILHGLGVEEEPQSDTISTKAFSALALRAGDIHRLTEALNGVRALQGWANAERQADLMSPPNDPSTKIAAKLAAALGAEKWLITKALPEIYKKHFDREFGYSTGKKGGPGPAITFVRECLLTLGIEKSLAAVLIIWKRRARPRGDELLGYNPPE